MHHYPRLARQTRLPVYAFTSDYTGHIYSPSCTEYSLEVHITLTKLSPSSLSPFRCIFDHTEVWLTAAVEALTRVAKRNVRQMTHGVIPFSADVSIKGTTFIKGTTLEGPRDKSVRFTAEHLTTASAEQVIKGAKVH